MKIYLFYLNSNDLSVFPALENSSDKDKSSGLYAWTTSKKFYKQFKSERDMNKFKIVVREVNDKTELNKFSCDFSSSLLALRPITTKTISNGLYQKETIKILCTSSEIETTVEETIGNALHKLLKFLDDGDVIIYPGVFTRRYSVALKKLNLDKVLEWKYPCEEKLPFDLDEPLTLDSLSIFVNNFMNTFVDEGNKK